MTKLFDILTRQRNLALFVVVTSVAALAFAYTAQFGFNLLPCHLCYEERKPYWLNIALGILAFSLATRKPKWSSYLLFLAGFSFFADAAIALFHVGTEQSWWKGLESCGGDGAAPPAGMSIEELQKYFANRPIVNCGVPTRLLGVSMATYNMIYVAGLSAVTFYFAWKGRPK